ncbi:PAS domain S-box protein [Aliifodinibius salicampi]|uniref:PAS domain S-box protein n=1 Tax=Fodinibius salicampi TaxID=1920655 RepID=A0ABT3PYE5_9BACT|nr:PAS domain S-box protein [Fodinibius salicampi]MCW9712801.1 PAS domain S-box protein [Fodinibius salicampi]
MDWKLFELNPKPVLVYGVNSQRVLKVNQAFCKKYGYSESEASSLTIPQLHPEEQRKWAKKALEDIQEDSSSRNHLWRHISKDGEQFFVEISSHSYSYEEVNARMVFIHDVTERIEAERKAQKAFDELNHHVNNSPLGMVKWNADFEIIEWNDRAAEKMGYSSEEVMGKTPYDFNYHSADELETVEQEMDYLISGKKEKSRYDVKLYDKNSELIDLRVHASARRNDDGALISVITFLEEVTEQKKIQLRYQRLFENANDGIFLMEKDRFIECNEQVCTIFGCSKNEILGNTPADFSPEYQPDGEPSLQKARKVINKSLTEGPQVFYWQHQRKDGSLIDTEVSLNSVSLGENIYIQAVVRDVTKQKENERKLRRSEELFRNLFLQAPSAMVMVDTENNVSKINKSFEDLFGYTEEEVLGQNLDEVLSSGDGAPKMSNDGLHGNRLYTDIKRYTKDGEELDLLLSIIPVHLDGEPIAGFGIYMDISEQKEYERKLKQSVHDKKILLEEIHHRVKNNLAIVSGLLQMQVMSVDDERLASYLQNSQLRIQSMSIVHEMLYQSKTLSEIEMDSYIEKLVRVITNTLQPEDKDIDVNVSSEDFWLNINQAIPCALIVNELVTNSFEYAFEGRDSGQLDVAISKKEDMVRVQVQDDGIGLPENFEEMRKTSLGMSLIENLTKQLETEIEIESGDWGSEFEFTFIKADKPGSSSSGKI